MITRKGGRGDIRVKDKGKKTYMKKTEGKKQMIQK